MRDKIVRRLPSWQRSGVVSQQRLRLRCFTLVNRVPKLRFEFVSFRFLACFLSQLSLNAYHVLYQRVIVGSIHFRWKCLGQSNIYIFCTKGRLMKNMQFWGRSFHLAFGVLVVIDFSLHDACFFNLQYDLQF